MTRSCTVRTLRRSGPNRTLFFFEARSGDPLGTFVHARPQTATENCTWHNYNIVPTDKRYVLVSGNYQSGVSVVDFTKDKAAGAAAFAAATASAPANPVIPPGTQRFDLGD